VSLERKYRRLSRLFPAKWRERNEEALIGTLLDAAEPGRDSVPLAEAIDLVRCAIILRFRALARRAVVGTRESAPLVGHILLGLVSAVAVALVIRYWITDISVDFVLASLVVALVPGTGVVYTVSSSLGGGWRRGLFAAVGCTFGVVPHVLAAMLGLSGVMQTGAVAFETVRWAGVAYLLYLGVSMIRGGGGPQVGSGPSHTAEPMGAIVRRGILLNLLNPKLTVFFFAFLPQFLETPPDVLDTRLIGLGGVFMIVTLVVFVVYAWVSAALRDRVLRAPVVLRWIRRSLGALLVGFAARLVVTDR